MPDSYVRTDCRLCHGTDLEPFLNLGMHPAADAFVTDRNAPEMTYPLEVAVCRRCGWHQLTYVVDPKILYQQDYPYEASVTGAGRQHFADLARDVVHRYAFKPGELAVDIGCNDGVLLEGLKRERMRVVGVDPAENIAKIGIEKGFMVYPEFFDVEAAQSIVSLGGQAVLITATNVFAHIDDLDGFMEAIDILLAERGVLMIEAPHFLRLVEQNEWDTIYHEHLSYITVAPLIEFFERHGFTLFDARTSGIHGGSLQLYVGRAPYPTMRTVSQMAYAEHMDDLFTPGPLGRLGRFAEDVRTSRDAIRRMVEGAYEPGPVAGISAPAKGSTLINYSGIGPYLQFLTERSGQKLGKFAPGSRLPVLPDAELVEQGIRYGIIFAWNFADDIRSRQRAFEERGGRFLVPIPKPRVLQAV